MALVESVSIPLGTPMPPFSLSDPSGKRFDSTRLSGQKGLLVAFTCNHCPYVIQSEERVLEFTRDYQPRGVAYVAINSNSANTYADDSFDHMKERAQERGFNFPYLRDESQDVARAYGALRTPHFYVFDENHKLRYTGRMDDNPRNPGQETTHELRDAVDALLANHEIEVPLTNPIGCNVKWAGKEKHWMPAEACDIV